MGTLNAHQIDAAAHKAEFCFESAGTLSAYRRTGRIACKDGSCAIDPSSADILHPCRAGGASQSSLNLFRPALAADAPGNAWIVPGLDVLSKANQSTGYTLFNIASEDFAWGQATSYTFEVRANGQPLYFDGIPPEDRVLDVSSKNKLALRFPIENLSFSGFDKGCERISVTLTLRNKDGSQKIISMARSYVALRNPPTIKIKIPSGATVEWSGRIQGNIGHMGEVFISSKQNASEIDIERKNFDNLHIYVGKTLLRGVIRPPYQDNLFYGLVVGERLETGQIRFVLSPEDVVSILSLVQKSGYGDAFTSAATGISPAAPAYDDKICPIASSEEP